MSSNSRNRWTVLDCLRSLAVLLVLCRHYKFVVDDQTFVGSALLWLQGRGWVGVDLFFVLSGFLVGHILFREHQSTGRIRGWRFLARRAFKIYPGFYLVIFLSALAILKTEEPPTARSTLSEVLFLQSYFPGLWRHTWSLAVEEHFYLLLTICVLALTGKQRTLLRFWPHLVGVICLFALVLRMITALNFPFDYARNLFPTHLRIDSLFLGSLLAYLFTTRAQELRAWYDKRKIPVAFLSAALILSPLLPLLEKSFYVQTVGFLMLGTGFSLALLVMLFEFPILGEHGLTRILSRAGRSSYATYLWHLPILVGLSAITLPEKMQNTVLGFIFYVVVAFAIGAFMTKMIEIPFLALRDRLLPTSTRMSDQQPLLQEPIQVAVE
jgi:peptidoglycan/LPS O-acetylase OafA/YrhL